MQPPIAIASVAQPHPTCKWAIPVGRIPELKKRIIIDDRGRELKFWGVQDGFVDFLYVNPEGNAIGSHYPVLY